MKKVVTIKDVTIGEGLPKICVPIGGRIFSEIIEEAKYLNDLDFDILEWRVDFFEDVTDISKVKEVLQTIRKSLENKPILFTFRSSREGGHREVSPEFYIELNKKIVEAKLVEIIDVELFNDEKDVKELVSIAHANNIAVIISNHDFYKTPAKEEMIYRLRKAQELGADIPKIAVMPKSKLDVLELLEATVIMSEKYADRPIITMSMSEVGVISRLAGEVFGSALTFGAAKKVSAPGQIGVEDLYNGLQLIHKYSK